MITADGAASASRRPLVAETVRARCDEPWRWTIRTVTDTGSTCDDLVGEAERGTDTGAVLIAELQTAGRGRLRRTWTSPPGAGLTMSVLLDPQGVAAARWGWISALTGLALAEAVHSVTGVDTTVKWPNDLQIEDRKAAGVLASRTADGRVVVGMGLNVSLADDELPRSDATSLLLAGAAELDRAVLAGAILGRLGSWFDRWVAARGDAATSGLAAAYRARSATLGREVRAELPDGSAVLGSAVDIADDGALVIHTATGLRTFAAGDVQHLRRAVR